MAKEPFPSDQQDKFMLRLPDGMRDRIRDAAERNGRSMNSEILVRIENSFDPTGTDLTFSEAQIRMIADIFIAELDRHDPVPQRAPDNSF